MRKIFLSTFSKNTISFIKIYIHIQHRMARLLTELDLRRWNEVSTRNLFHLRNYVRKTLLS